MESIYRKIVKADLGIDGACKKQSRASLLQRSDSLPLPNSENVPYSRKLSSLQRTLKVRQEHGCHWGNFNGVEFPGHS